jgi:hypothetical protein
LNSQVGRDFAPRFAQQFPGGADAGTNIPSLKDRCDSNQGWFHPSGSWNHASCRPATQSLSEKRKTHKSLDLTGYFWGFDSR